MSTSEYNSVVLITGPDNEDEVAPVLSVFVKRVPDAFVIGNGKASIMNQSGDGEFPDGMKKISGIQAFTDSAHKTLIIINAHGTISEGKHYIQLDDESLVDSADLFAKIYNAFHKPVDIIFTACHGRGALKDTYILPHGSRIMIFSDADQYSYSQNFLFLAKSFPQDAILSFRALFDFYLMNLGSNERPILFEVGGDNTINPYASAQKYLGKHLDEAAKLYATNKLVAMCAENEKCTSNALEVPNKLEHTNDLIETLQPYEKYLEVFRKVSHYHLNFFNSTEYLSLHNKSPSSLIEHKAAVDKLLEAYEIPLSINLDELAKDTSEFDADDNYISLKIMNTPEYGTYVSAYSLYTGCGNSALQPNSAFPAPEKSDYGALLLASLYLDEYYVSLAGGISVNEQTDAQI